MLPYCVERSATGPDDELAHALRVGVAPGVLRGEPLVDVIMPAKHDIHA